MFSAQHPHGRAVRQRVGNVAVNPVGPTAFVPVPVPEPQSPLASGLHWADGLAAAPQQQQQQSPASQASPFLGGGSQVQVLPALEADLPSAFKPMDLEQVSSRHCRGGGQLGAVGIAGGLWQQCALHEMPRQRPVAAVADCSPARPSTCLLQDVCGVLWDAEPQPWYFGGSLDLCCLGVSFKPSEEALPMAMDCSAPCPNPPACGDDDEIPLLTLDLGGEEV
jgi:hypothetical protein